MIGYNKLATPGVRRTPWTLVRDRPQTQNSEITVEISPHNFLNSHILIVYIMADRVWHVVSNCVPLHTLYEAVDVDYQQVIANLYSELYAREFSPDCVECLKKRPRRSDDHSLSLYDIFCCPNMSGNCGMTESIFETKLETMNIWQRYDFESYLMVAAIIIIKTCKPDLQWTEKWKSIEDFKGDFPTLAADRDAPRLLIFANILHNVLRYCPSVKNFQRILTICVCLAEGPYHTRLITGSSQCSYTEARVTTLNLVTQRHQYQRRSFPADARSQPRTKTSNSDSISTPKARKKGDRTGRLASGALSLGRTVPGTLPARRSSDKAKVRSINQSLRSNPSTGTPFNTRSDNFAAQLEVDENTSPAGDRDSLPNYPGYSGVDPRSMPMSRTMSGSKFCEDYSPMTPMRADVVAVANTTGSINSINLFGVDSDTMSMGSNLLSIGDAVYSAESIYGPAEVAPLCTHNGVGRSGRRILGSAVDLVPRETEKGKAEDTGIEADAMTQMDLHFGDVVSEQQRLPVNSSDRGPSGRDIEKQQIIYSSCYHHSQAFGQNPRAGLSYAHNENVGGEAYGNNCQQRCSELYYHRHQEEEEEEEKETMYRHSGSRRMRSLSTTLSSNTALTHTGGSVNYSSIFSNTGDPDRDRGTHGTADTQFLSQFRTASMNSAALSHNDSFTNDANWMDCTTAGSVERQSTKQVPDTPVAALDANVNSLRRRLRVSLDSADARSTCPTPCGLGNVDMHLQSTLNKILPANIVDDILDFGSESSHVGTTSSRKSSGPSALQAGPASESASVSRSDFGFASISPLVMSSPSFGYEGEQSSGLNDSVSPCASGDGKFVSLGVNDHGHPVFICVLPR